MKKKLVIIGNSGAARECFWLAEDIIANRANLEFKGFLAFENYPQNLKELAHLEIGADDLYKPEPDDVFAIGIGLPELREKCFIKWKEKGVEFINLIHPSAVFTGCPRIGEANIIARGSYISCNAILGNGNYLNGSVVIGHDCQIGSFNFFAPFSILLGNVHIKNCNSFGVHCVVMPNASIGSGNRAAPGACLYKGCKDNKILAGNPAYTV